MLSPGASARAVPAEVAASNQSTGTSFTLEGLSFRTTSPIPCIMKGLLKAIHDLSDADLVDRSTYNMSFKYCLDMTPEEDVIDSSSLT